MNDIYILVVDDNPAIHIDFRKILETGDKQKNSLKAVEASMLGKAIENDEFNFIIDSAYQSEEALELINKSKRNNRPYSLAFIDIRMPPGIDGVQTTKRIWEIDPEIQIVICTAYSDYSWETITKLIGGSDRLLILKKPFENIEVQQIANAMTKKWQISKLLQEQMKHLKEIVDERTSELEHALSLMTATLESTSDGVLFVNLNQKIINFNQKFLAILKIPQVIMAELDDAKARDFITAQLKNPKDFINKANEAYEHPELKLSDTLTFKDGRIIEYFSEACWLNQKVIGRVFSFRDITENKKMEEQLIYQATHDSLTNLPNRLVLLDRLQREIAAANRNGTIAAILFVDLDRFKLINDTLGHDAGDEILKIISFRLQHCIREMDTLARISDDEFIIVLPLTSKIDDIIPICQKILTSISEAFEIKKQTITLTASIGISFYPKDGKEVNVLIKNADSANQLAKESGRNTFKFFTEELNINATRRLMLENNLRLALKNNEFLLLYQPIINTTTKKIISLEALLRWNHPKLGLVSPEEFVPVAEEIGLMLMIGDWVLNTACAQNKTWRDQSVTALPIAVNFTAEQIAQSNVVEKVAAVLKKNNLDPSCLEIELTESTIIEGYDSVRIIMQELKKIGVKLLIDDFGTGYSSLAYLNRLPIDKIKIDRSFITYISQNPNDVVVIQAIIAMAKVMSVYCCKFPMVKI